MCLENEEEKQELRCKKKKGGGGICDIYSLFYFFKRAEGRWLASWNGSSISPSLPYTHTSTVPTHPCHAFTGMLHKRQWAWKRCVCGGMLSLTNLPSLPKS